MDAGMRGAHSAIGKLGDFASGLRKKRFGAKMSPVVTISVESGGAPKDETKEEDMEKLRQMYGDLG